MKLDLWLAASAAVLSLAACGPKPAPADMVLYNAKVLTVDKDFSIKQAVAVKDGKILAVGGEEIARNYQAPVELDLGGRVLMPGFTDTHLHIQGLAPRQIDMRAAKSIADIQALVRDKAKALGPGEWITGQGWDEALLAEKRNINRADLDAAAPGNPVVLTRAGGHSSVGNSLALRIAGVTRSTKDPDAGLIEHGPDGEPNGIIRERNDLYYRHVPPATFEQMKPSYIAAMQRLFPLGITSFHSASTSIDDEPVGQGGIEKPGPGLTFRRLQQIAREADIPRVTLYVSYPGPERLKAFPHHSGYGDERVRLGAIGENPVDGGFTGPTAWTLKDYKGLPGFRGKGRFTDEELQALVDTSAGLGWQMGLHAIGDAAIVQAVNAYVASLKKYPGLDHKGADRRWFLDHFTIMPPEATMKAMADNQVAIVQQPNFSYNLEGRYVETLDEEQLAHANSVATPAKRFGIFTAFSSDNLPIDPRVGLYVAVTRKGASGKVYGAEEAVPRAEAIRMYTANPAYLSWEETLKGTVEPGKLADLIVMDADPLTAPEAQLLTMNVDMTILGGKVVYDRSKEGR